MTAPRQHMTPQDEFAFLVCELTDFLRRRFEEVGSIDDLATFVQDAFDLATLRLSQPDPDRQHDDPYQDEP